MEADEGVEYRSERFNQLGPIVGVPDEAVDVGDGGYDGFTDDVMTKNAVKLAIYIPAPTLMGFYVGFAPPDIE